MKIRAFFFYNYYILDDWHSTSKCINWLIRLSVKGFLTKQIILKFFQFVMQAWNLVRNIFGYYFTKKSTLATLNLEMTAIFQDGGGYAVFLYWKN